MLILPAIDIRDGKCVRLYQGDYAQETVYGEDPSEVAKSFEDAGATYIHLVDLDAAKAGQPVNIDAIEKIRSRVGCKLELGGGIRTSEAVRQMLEVGLDRLILGTVLVRNPEFRMEAFAAFGDQVVAGIDAKNGMVSVAGWEDTSEVDAVHLAQIMESEGAKRFIVTDIATDGTLAGPNTDFLLSFTRALKSPVIASGGIGNAADLDTVAGLNPPVEGVIVGKAIYERKLNLNSVLLKYPG